MKTQDIPEKANDVKEKAQDWAETVGEQADVMSEYIRGNIWKSVAIAAAVGATLGFLLGRSKDG